ncbi:hypothetical protein HPP92_021093 [Vanilla planifolia]|uniref:Uncharacterized protein n=1 Tax=Vanilla planifolia TaxID=51239 RepID=A0A835UIM9_VANPL|nr:hypothetical protein HPP92_021093 [Vanilla planifolia]
MVKRDNLIKFYQETLKIITIYDNDNVDHERMHEMVQIYIEQNSLQSLTQKVATKDGLRELKRLSQKRHMTGSQRIKAMIKIRSQTQSLANNGGMATMKLLKGLDAYPMPTLLGSDNRNNARSNCIIIAGKDALVD